MFDCGLGSSSLQIQGVKESSKIDSRHSPGLVSIAIVTVMSLDLWAPKLGRWQRPEVATAGYYSDSPTVQSVVSLPMRVGPADGSEGEEPRGVF